MGLNHNHGAARPELGPRLVAGIFINLAILVAQLIGGVLSGSLALIADALHNLTDVASLIVSYAADRIAKRPATDRFTFAFQRTEVLAAVVNAGGLAAISVYIGIEAVKRLAAGPQPVEGGIVVLFAGFGMVANAGAAWLLRGQGSNLNARSAMLHLVSDSVASLGVLIAGVVIRLTGWGFVDPIASLALAAWMLKESVGLTTSAVRILMQGAPERMEAAEVEAVMKTASGVADVHDLHVWAINPENVVVSAHLVLAGQRSRAEEADILQEVKRALHERLGVEHVTLEVDQDARCAGSTCAD